MDDILLIALLFAFIFFVVSMLLPSVSDKSISKKPCKLHSWTHDPNTGFWCTTCEKTSDQIMREERVDNNDV